MGRDVKVEALKGLHEHCLLPAYIILRIFSLLYTKELLKDMWQLLVKQV